MSVERGIIWGISTHVFHVFLEHERRVAPWLVFPSSREKISRLPTTPFGYGYLSSILRQFMVISDHGISTHGVHKGEALFSSSLYI